MSATKKKAPPHAVMDDAAVTGVRNSRLQMRAANEALAETEPMLTTGEALRRCPLGEICSVTLVRQPDWILPRVELRPGAKKVSYRWDPRDLLVLPVVLRQWAEAKQNGTEKEFELRRRAALLRRDLEAMGLAGLAWEELS